jgi:hypothetical protein
VAVDWEGPTEGGGGTTTMTFDGRKIGEGIGDFGVRGRWTESREDGEAATCLSLGEREQSGKGERDGGRHF